MVTTQKFEEREYEKMETIAVSALTLALLVGCSGKTPESTV
jgi:hypothetical protein